MEEFHRFRRRLNHNCLSWLFLLSTHWWLVFSVNRQFFLQGNLRLIRRAHDQIMFDQYTNVGAEKIIMGAIFCLVARISLSHVVLENTEIHVLLLLLRDVQ